MNSVGAAGSVKGLHKLLHLLHSGTGTGCQVLLDVSPPDWAALRKAAHRPGDEQAPKYVEREGWAVLRCYLTYGAFAGEEFPLLFAEASVVAKAANAAGWRSRVVHAGADGTPALVRLWKSAA
mmetsp:Transcript_58586/g.162137  ORF Transcript_58586/g.162137 Transcript_58586/m.162137 type:complete len:123 (-) Transcript_58586:78-446(-)